MVLTYILCNQPTSQSQCNSLEKKCFQERIKKKKETAEISEFLSLASRGKQQQNQPSLNQRGIPKDDLNKVFFKVRYYLSKIALNQFRVVAKFILLPYSSIFFFKTKFLQVESSVIYAMPTGDFAQQYIALADLPQGAISSKTHFGVNGLFFFKLSNSKSVWESKRIDLSSLVGIILQIKSPL